MQKRRPPTTFVHAAFLICRSGRARAHIAVVHSTSIRSWPRQRGLVTTRQAEGAGVSPPRLSELATPRPARPHAPRRLPCCRPHGDGRATRLGDGARRRGHGRGALPPRPRPTASACATSQVLHAALSRAVPAPVRIDGLTVRRPRRPPPRTTSPSTTASPRPRPCGRHSTPSTWCRPSSSCASSNNGRSSAVSPRRARATPARTHRRAAAPNCADSSPRAELGRVVPDCEAGGRRSARSSCATDSPSRRTTTWSRCPAGSPSSSTASYRS